MVVKYMEIGSIIGRLMIRGSMHGFIINGTIGNTVGNIDTISGIGKQVILYVYRDTFKLFDFVYDSEVAVGIVEDEECRTDNLIGGW